MLTLHFLDIKHCLRQKYQFDDKLNATSKTPFCSNIDRYVQGGFLIEK
uniref:Uncharacterized protein n=1 Tax=Anguilla anguilla TaxID=7936 RepID=A0A0E9PTJ1_ANGAN